ncbi:MULTISPECIES: ComEC/Rec2 family competence protein [Micromonospora]|uniref:ComEC/Rec2 family competence protein n=1 Tax=Micromonospora TaxID=1873 RepID=UPI0013153F47|nr:MULTISPECIES: MBL fold metallo-hydrolase [Micromonospora]
MNSDGPKSVGSLTIIDVGHGSCAVIAGKDSAVLVDSGPSASVLEYLLEQGIRIIDTVVLSHADSDHIRGLVALLGADDFEVRRVLLNTDSAKSSEIWQSLAYEVDDCRRRHQLDLQVQLREGDEISVDIPGVELSVLAPRDRLVMLGPGARDHLDRRLTSNSVSAVILVKVEDRRLALITGDLDEIGFDHLRDTRQDLSAEILVFPHHGGLSGSNPVDAGLFAYQLAQAVRPRQVAISLGRGRYPNPRPEIVEGIRTGAAEARVACTQLSGECCPKIPNVSATHLLPLYARGRRDGVCCAGTMRVDLGHDDGLLPKADGHMDYIRQVAPASALCTRVLPQQRDAGSAKYADSKDGHAGKGG